jgi:hypothetical protein
MGRAILPEWTVNLLALGKDHWWFKFLEYPLNLYHQQWRAGQHKQIIANMAGKMPGKSNNGIREKNERNNHNTNGGRIGGHQYNNVQGGRERGSNNSKHLKKNEHFNCRKRSLFDQLLCTKKE